MRLTVSLPDDVGQRLIADAIANDRSGSGQVRWLLLQRYAVKSSGHMLNCKCNDCKDMRK